MNLVAPLLDAPPLRRQSPPTVYRGVNPAAGANFVQSVDDGLWWRVVSIFARFTPSADVASREVTIDYRDQEDSTYARFGAPLTVPASDTTDFYFSAFRKYADWEVNSTVLVPIDPIILPPSHDFSIVIVNIQTTDTLTRIRFIAEKFYPASSDDYPAFA